MVNPLHIISYHGLSVDGSKWGMDVLVISPQTLHRLVSTYRLGWDLLQTYFKGLSPY